MDDWVTIYSGHDEQVEQDQRKLDDKGIPAQTAASSTEVIASPYLEEAIPATELQVPVQFAARAREVLDLSENQEQDLTPSSPAWAYPMGILAALSLMAWFVLVAVTTNALVGVSMFLIVGWITVQCVRHAKRKAGSSDV